MVSSYRRDKMWWPSSLFHLFYPQVDKQMHDDIKARFFSPKGRESSTSRWKKRNWGSLVRAENPMGDWNESDLCSSFSSWAFTMERMVGAPSAGSILCFPGCNQGRPHRARHDRRRSQDINQDNHSNSLVSLENSSKFPMSLNRALM